MQVLLGALRIFKMRWRGPASLGALALAVVLVGGIYSEVRSLKEKIENSVVLWEPDLAKAFASDDWLSIKRVGSSLRFDEVEALSISSQKSLIYIFPENHSESDCSISVRIPVSRYGYVLGRVQACTSITALFAQIIRSPLALATSIALAILLLITSILPLMKYRSAALLSLQTLRAWANGSPGDSLSLPESDLKANDPVLMEVVKLVSEGVHRRVGAEREVVKLRSKEELGMLAAQVAHDIRSPLAALETVAHMSADLPEDMRVIVRLAVGRIGDIANSLLLQNRQLAARTNSEVSGVAAIEPQSLQLLSGMIDALVTEKRMQFRSSKGIEIEFELDHASYGIFAEVQPTELKRLLSNLLNNSVEVLKDKGRVKVRLEPGDQQDRVILVVEDDGKGISPKLLARLGQRGETHGKEGGSGLGLFHARISVEKWGGTLRIESQVGKGTRVLITLPRAKEPDWFVPALGIAKEATIVILDDDSSIYQIWRGRFDSAFSSDGSKPKLIHFTKPDELIAWHGQSAIQADSVVYLCDYELIGSEKTGLDAIVELGIGPQSVLVTSRFEEPLIRERCQKLGVKLIPKGMVGFVVIHEKTVPGQKLARYRRDKKWRTRRDSNSRPTGSRRQQILE